MQADLKLSLSSIFTVLLAALAQGCQMVSFQTKNPNFGQIWRALGWKRLLYFMPI
jgi:hypothetical protein